MLRLERLSLNNVGMGLTAERFNEYLNLLTQDVVSRPEIDKPRTITLTVEIKPKYDRETRINMPVITAKISTKQPGPNDIEISGIVDDGEVKVNIDDGENPLQTSILSFETKG